LSEHQEKRKAYAAYSFYLSLVFQMGAVIALGSLGGNWLDKHFEFEKPILTIVLSLLSVFMGLYLFFRGIIAKQKESEKEH
jgi:uncharacterized membrane protein YfcA